MALYTETLSDWLKNGWELPLIFDLIPSIDNGNGNITTFKEFFEDYFSEWEIGFETETLFNKKLNVTARIVCPLYKIKIEQITAKMNDGIFKNGKTSNNVVRNYFNNETISQLSDNQGNSAVSETNETSGSSARESITDVMIKYQNDIQSLYQRLLDEFKKLFMGLC